MNVSALSAEQLWQLAWSDPRATDIQPVSAIRRRTPDGTNPTTDEADATDSQNTSTDGDTVELSAAARSSADDLSTDEQREVDDLEQTDTEVRAHEAAHVAAGGSFVRGGASFSYQTGPDGKQYAVGGEVSIDTSEISDDPAATVQKMQTVLAAALAPAEPSSQDHQVAAQAQAKLAEAQAELASQQAATATSTGESTDAEAASAAAESTPSSAALETYARQTGSGVDAEPTLDIRT